MNPNLVCKIEVTTTDGSSIRGSGYPITRNRIITAAHVVEDAAPIEENSGARQIKLSFGLKNQEIDKPVEIEWSGRKHGIDVAVLGCPLPNEFQPTHRLLTERLEEEKDWCAHGFTEYGKKKTDNGIDVYRGKCPHVSIDARKIDLESSDGPDDEKDWAGGSGSAVFESTKAGRLLAVVTDYRGGKLKHHLVAVPICYLLNAEVQREFKPAICFDQYKQRADHRSNVLDKLTAELKRLESDVCKGIAGKLAELRGEQIENHTAEYLAKFMVDECSVDVVVHTLVGIMKDLDETQHCESLAAAVDHILPLNYAPTLIEHLRESLTQGGMSVVEGNVATSTLAEVIMAGYDRKPAKFSDCLHALEYGGGPVEGPGDIESDGNLRMLETRNLLADLVGLVDEVLQKPAGRRDSQSRDHSAVAREIDGYAKQLRGALKAIQLDEERTVYCVLRLPKNQSQRDFHKSVLTAVREKVPSLVFVELVSWAEADERESTIESFISLRLLRTRGN